MAHARQQIREAIGTTLIGLTTTGSNVFQSRVYPLETADLPGLIVYTTSEETDEYSGTRAIRILSVMIEGYAKATNDVDDVMDNIAEEVESIISSDPSIGGRCIRGILLGTEIELSSDYEKPLGKISLGFEFQYYIDSTDPGTLL